MASKRAAGSELNADNWNDSDEPEDPGTFKRASDDVLSKRVLKLARRRITKPAGETSKSAFCSFAGFKATPSTTTASPFSFLSNIGSEPSTATTTGGFTLNNTPTTNNSTKISENGVGTSAASMSSSSLLSKDSKTIPPASTEKDTTSAKKPTEYYAKLKGLNQSVAQWIKTHVDVNPVCILTPIFRDYEKYLKEIELKHGKEIESSNLVEKKTEVKSTFSENAQALANSLSASAEKKQDSLIFGKVDTKSAAVGSSDNWKSEKSVFGSPSIAPKSIFSTTEKSESSPFGISSGLSTEKNPFLSKSPATETKTSEKPSNVEEKSSSDLTFPQTSLSSGTFSFGQSSSGSPVSAGFSFGGGAPITFGAAAVKQDKEENTANNGGEKKEDDEYEPPKPDIKSITEEGSVYEQKCKVFEKKDNTYADRGVGTLFLKPAPNDKMQLIVRAVNSLGNLLLNTLLTDSIPIKRLNKTNIMLVCLPLPTSSPPPVATLLRVKTPEEADALFEALEKHKK